ncbi:MAG: ligase-associated DNA damage response endonuclease PdeM, partial [Gillisia sp.]
MTAAVKINGQNFTFHSSGAMFWQEKSMLLISDVHLGKISHFRKFGSAVPHNAIVENFDNLSAVVGFFNPQKICFLGDLFHSVLNKEWHLFEEWIASVSSEVFLVVGNHDIISEIKYEGIGVKVGSEILIDDYFFLTHHPEKREGFFNICGHLHPGYKLRGRGRQSIK